MKLTAAILGIVMSLALMAAAVFGATAAMPAIRTFFAHSGSNLILGLIPAAVAIPFIYRRVRDYGFSNVTLDRKSSEHP